MQKDTRRNLRQLSCICIYIDSGNTSTVTVGAVVAAVSDKLPIDDYREEILTRIQV
jgi:hypothetical protein